MSRTDKTRPFSVRQEEHKILYPRRTEPIYTPDRYWLGELRCGCPLCADTQGRKEKARKERYKGRKEARDWKD